MILIIYLTAMQSSVNPKVLTARTEPFRAGRNFVEILFDKGEKNEYDTAKKGGRREKRG
jgi:hypothetical protein